MNPTAVVVDVITMTDDPSSTDHYVSDGAAGAGRRSGVYRAVCGATVRPGSLTGPIGPACPQCREWAAMQGATR